MSYPAGPAWEAAVLTPDTIYSVLAERAAEMPDEFAIMAPGRRPLTFRGLLSQVDAGVQALCALGVTRESKVAISLPKSPEMVAVHLAALSVGISAPINPDAGMDEATRLLRELDATALIVPVNGHAAARQGAADAHVPVINLTVGSEVAGTFSLAGDQAGRPAEWTPPTPESVAVLLRTSGTTGTPKLIPKTHRDQVMDIPLNVKRYQRGDRVITVMPLFHVQGLFESVNPLLAGVTVIVTPRFDPSKFFNWFAEFKPTHFNAVPSMHQALMPFARENVGLVRGSKIRYVSSSSAPMPWPLKMEMEEVYGFRVIVGYGGTEFGGVARTPMPPEEDKPGSVGTLNHNLIGIFDEQGNRLATGQRGEICVSGPKVIKGFWNNVKADKKAFRNGWYRTGDEGYLDADGYLFITGRTKEIINRGGEKVSPFEVDDVLRAHPAVEQVCTFGVKHPGLGEAVAAAVVVRPGTAATEQQIRDFAASKLSYEKLPQKLFFVPELPKNAIGKLERASMAQRLGVTWEHLSHRTDGDRGQVVAPRTPTERMVAELWTKLLPVKEISVNDHFLDLGGDSMHATRLLGIIADKSGIEIPMVDFFNAATVAEQAALLDAAMAPR